MRRRELVLLLGGAMAAAAQALHVQQRTMPVIGFLVSVNPNFSAVERQTGEVGRAAHARGLRLSILKAGTEREIGSAADKRPARGRSPRAL